MTRLVWIVGWLALGGCAEGAGPTPVASAAPMEATAAAQVSHEASAGPTLPVVSTAAAAAEASSRPSTSATEPAPEPPKPCPSEMVHVGRYCIDRFEAHLITIDPAGVVRRHPHHLRPPAGQWYAAHNAKGAMPQAYISRREAAGACKRAGKRLCRWLEWRRACQGRHWRRYPYGNGGRRGVCNTGRKHLLHELFRAEKPWGYEEHFNSPLMSLAEGYLAPGGSFEGCVSEDGVHDMNGNLHEWVSSTVTDDFIERMEGENVEREDQPWRVGNGMFLGGFYSTTGEHGPGCFYTTVAHEPTYHDYSTGFRCCADAIESEEGGPSRN